MRFFSSETPVPDNPFEEMSKVSQGESRRALDQRIQREHNVQTQARIIRRICRWTFVIGGLVSIGGLMLGICLELPMISGLACTLLPITVIAGVVLFFMGGMAPGRVRNVLNDREKRLLDD